MITVDNNVAEKRLTGAASLVSNCRVALDRRV